MTPAPLRAGWRYGLLGLPLAFVALPLYVQLPTYYAREFGVPLAALGLALLFARLFDAVIDPLLGVFADRLLARPRRLLPVMGAAGVVLVAGFAMLLFPPVRDHAALLAWAVLSLVITYSAYSLLSVLHQSWGAMLGGDESAQARIVGWREALALAGVLCASVLPSVAGWRITAAVLAAALVAALAALQFAARPAGVAQHRATREWTLPFGQRPFVRLLAVFLLNGIATAIPATLLLPFMQDRLQAPAAIQPAFLLVYFVCAAVSVPLWLAGVRRFGLARCWLAGMLLAVLGFAWAATLGTGDVLAYAVICAASGFALGSDLAMPGALLAGVIARAGHRGQREGLYFGWWNFATKLNLALAAGIALPALGLAGYAPGTRDPAALSALTWAYCALPCLLKLGAAGLLYFAVIRPGDPP